MKTYRNFILLESNKDIISTIFDKCQPFIKLLRSCENKKLVYHSTNANSIYSNIIYPRMKNDMTIIERRDREKSKDLNINIHNYVGDLLIKKFGYNPRKESLFCHNGEIEAVEEYGQPFIMFPIGDFKYVWNPEYHDLYLHLWSKYSIPYWDQVPKYEDIDDTYKDVYKEIYKECDKYAESCIDTGFCKFLTLTNEIMIWAEEYILIVDEEEEKYVNYTNTNYADIVKEIWK